MIDGKVRWFHRNEKGETVFSAESNGKVIEAKKWVELAVTYNSDGTARIYCDSVLIKEEKSDQMTLSQDWGAFAGKKNIFLSVGIFEMHVCFWKNLEYETHCKRRRYIEYTHG